MTTTRPRKKSIAILAAVVALTVPMAACAANEPVASKVLVAERTVQGTIDSAAGTCRQVDAPMLDIPTAGDTEPRMRIPLPAGWERTSELDNVDEAIRFALAATVTVPGERPQNIAVVTLESAPDIDAQTAFDDFRVQIADMLATKELSMDMETTAGTVCGLPAETLTIKNRVIGMGAAFGGQQGLPVTALAVVAKAGGLTYLVTVTTTAEPDSTKYQRDIATILTGFEVLSPAAGQQV
jgi:hypothetical protein